MIITLLSVREHDVLSDRKEEFDDVDEGLDDGDVSRSRVHQSRVLHLDGQLSPLMVRRHVHLRQRGAGDGCGVETAEKRLQRPTQLLLDHTSHIGKGRQRTLVQNILLHRTNVLLRQEVVLQGHSDAEE